MKVPILIVICLCACVYAEEKAVEARGKGKYALLTHLAILLATKVGLYKVILGIALVVTAVKAMVVMAWALAIFKYVPDVWQHKETGWHKQSLPDWHTQGVPGGQASSLFLDMLTMHFFYVAATKLFILKVVYGVIFYILATKAWHLLLWLIHYLKEKKRHEHYVEIDHDHDFHQFHGPEYESYGPHSHESYGPHEYESQSYESRPYSAYEKPVYGRIQDKRVYDADGSYSIAAN